MSLALSSDETQRCHLSTRQLVCLGLYFLFDYVSRVTGLRVLCQVLSLQELISFNFQNAKSDYTIVILINATTLMHNSILSTNNFGNNHFGQKV